MAFNYMLNSEEFEKKLDLDNIMLKDKIQKLKDSVRKIGRDTRIVLNEKDGALNNNFSEEFIVNNLRNQRQINKKLSEENKGNNVKLSNYL